MNLILERFRRKVFGTDRLLARLSTLEDQVRRLQTEVDARSRSTPPESKDRGDFAGQHGPVGDYPVNVYNEHIPWEIPVQLCLKDFIKHGDCVLDVGANIGGVAIAMSRLVGQSGQVHAFEANPSTLRRLQADLDANGAGNVTAVGKAVWCKTGERLDLQIDDGYYACASSLISCAHPGRKVTVETITLDDYCQRHQLVPRAIKLDVGAAEYFVLIGAERTIRQHSPVIIFEYCPSRTGEDPAAFLQSLGYVLYDTNTYQRVDRQYYLSNYGPNPTANVLAVPPTQASVWSVSLSPPTEMEIEAAGLRTKAFRF